MELTKASEYRQSIRKYVAEKSIPEEDIRALIKFAQEAPSWKNFQSGRYFVAASPEKMQEVREKCLPSFNAKSTADASAYIITTFEKGQSGFNLKGEKDTELGDEWGAYDLGLQNAYLILKAAELGLDTLIMGIRDEKALRECFEIPESQQIVAVIAVGYRDQTPDRRPRKELEEIARFF